MLTEKSGRGVSICIPPTNKVRDGIAKDGDSKRASVFAKNNWAPFFSCDYQKMVYDHNILYSNRENPGGTSVLTHNLSEIVPKLDAPEGDNDGRRLRRRREFHSVQSSLAIAQSHAQILFEACGQPPKIMNSNSETYIWIHSN